MCNYLFLYLSKSFFSVLACSKLQYINFTPRNLKQNNYDTHWLYTTNNNSNYYKMNFMLLKIN